MDGISGAGSTQDADGTNQTVQLTLLKKAQDMMKENSAALLATLPQPMRSPSPPGVGGQIDLTA